MFEWLGKIYKLIEMPNGFSDPIVFLQKYLNQYIHI